MSDKRATSTRNSLLEQWNKKPDGSLHSSTKLSLSSGLMTGSALGRSSLLSSSLVTPSSSFVASSSLSLRSSLLSGSLAEKPAKPSSPIESGLINLSLQSEMRIPVKDAQKKKVASKSHHTRELHSGKRDISRKRVKKHCEETEKKKKVESKNVISTQVIRSHTISQPVYDIGYQGDTMEVESESFLHPSKDQRLASKIGKSLVDVMGVKRGLINCVSGSLISQPKFSDKSDATRHMVVESVSLVVDYDPEFILKVALYSRKELNIRTTSNFLLALASHLTPCRQYLKKYFRASINLPSDWIEVAELFQTFDDRNLKLGALPASLRKAMISKFPEFDKYQLAKYNKQSSGKKKAKAVAQKKDAEKKKKAKSLLESDSSDDEEDDSKRSSFRQLKSISYDEKESEEELKKQKFTIKQLIRKLHIKAPVEHVMCIIGKKYPFTLEEFYKSSLPGMFEEERAGKRMKLPVPETWETQVSLKGNKAETWQTLIDNKKLPFMAMLRNLRNLIKAGISTKHHNLIIKRLCDQYQVANSKQFPFRFFSAYVALHELEEAHDKNQQDQIEAAEAKAISGSFAEAKQIGLRGRGRGRGRGVRGGGRGARGGIGARGRGGVTKASDDFAWWKLKKLKKEANNAIEGVLYDKPLIQRYRKALDTSVKIATVHNVQPIKGRTILLCDIGESMDVPCTSAKGLGKPRTLREISTLMGLMCKYSCEECELIVYKENNFMSVELLKGTILDNMDAVFSATFPSNTKNMVNGLPYTVLFEKLRDRVQVDNLLVFGEDFHPSSEKGRVLSDFLHMYRHLVNPNLLYVAVSFSGKQPRVATEIKPEHDNDIYLSGYSDSILRFIAERGDSGQVDHVDKIDEAYQLRPMPKMFVDQNTKKPEVLSPNVGLKLISSTPKWRTIRVFISSTFRDMHAERDLLTRFVFPELREFGRKRFLNIYEVDLRWGVTEEDTRSNKTLELCLNEVSQCQVFIGLLGERYGWTPETYEVPDTKEFDWVRQYPPGASVTELEMQLGALAKPMDVKDSAFFFLRDNTFENDVPDAFADDFKAESEHHRSKMLALKTKIKCSGLDVANYTCQWGGLVDGKPMLAGLDQFGARMLNTLLNALEKFRSDDDDALTEEDHIINMQWAFIENTKSAFIGRTPLIKQIISSITTSSFGTIGLVGRSGSGKTALLATVVNEYLNAKQSGDAFNILINFAGIAPGTNSLTSTLRRFAQLINSRFSLGYALPEDFKNLKQKLADMLAEAASISTSKLVIFMDGTDNMDPANEPFNLEWLPTPVPTNVVFVLTAVEGDKTHKSLKRVAASEMNVGNLDMWDKAEIVRHTLAKHRKALNESGFGNQMKLLMLKKDAHNPLYLKLACEELRVFGVFEKVSEKLKTLPHTTFQMLQEVLTRLETDHGKEVVSTALGFLACVRDGLYPEELNELLNWNKLIGKSSFRPGDMCSMDFDLEEQMPSMKFATLARSIMSFLNPGSLWAPVLSLGNAEICTAVRLRYFRSTDNPETYLHKLLAGFFYRLSDPKNDNSWQSKHSRAFSELTYHLTCAGCLQELERILCSHQFIQTKCSLGLAAKLLDDFLLKGPIRNNRQTEKEHNKFLSQPRVQQYKSFISRNIEVLVNYPSLEWQQAMNESRLSLPYQDAVDIKSSLANLPSYMEWCNRPEKENPCYMTMSQFKIPPTSVRVSPNGSYIACGSKDAVVRLFDMLTGKEQRQFLGHSDAITDVCFIGNSHLCSASADTTLSIWDVENGHRIHTLKKHGRRVSSCASDNTNKMIASGGWDCTVYVWNVNDGRWKCSFDLGSPVNSVQFHPSDELLVVGSWNSLITIYNVFHKTKIAVLRGHTTSVRNVAYSVDGRHLASASLDGDVKIWAADKGSQVGSIKGHAGPINELMFSPSGKEIITASDDHQVKVWSGNLGCPIIKFNTNKLGAATSISISPDGLTVAVGCHLGYVRIHDTNTGVKLAQASVCSSPVRCITFSKSGAYILAGCDDNFVQILEAHQGSPICKLIGHTKPVLCIDAAKNYIASGGEDFTCCVYGSVTEIKASKTPMPSFTLTYHVAPLSSCTFNADGTLLATASRDTNIAIYNVKDMFMTQNTQPKQVITFCHADWINSCRWSNISDHLVTASNDFNLKLWDVKTGSEKMVLQGHSSAINTAAFKFGCIVSGSSDGKVKVWSHKGVEITTLHGHKLRVNACDIYVNANIPEDEDEDKSWADMAMDTDEKTSSIKTTKHRSNIDLKDVIVASAGDDEEVWLWRPLQAYSVACLAGHSDRVTSLGANKECQIVSCALDNSVKLWNPTLSHEIDNSKHDAPVTFVAVSNNAEIVVTGCRDGSVKIWKMGNGNRMYVRHSFQAHGKAVNCGCFEGSSPDHFVTGGDDCEAISWHIIDRKDGFFLRKQHLGNLSTPVSSLVYNTKASKLFASTWAGEIFVLSSTVMAESMYSMNGTTDKSSTKAIKQWPTVLTFDLTNPQRLMAGTTCSSLLGFTLSSNFHTVMNPSKTSVSTEDVDSGIDEIKRTPNWINCLVCAGSTTFAGDSRGQLHIFRDSESCTLKVHKSAITSLVVFEETIFTSSLDSSIKIWKFWGNKMPELKQVGQFFSQSPITSMSFWKTAPVSMDLEVSLVVGDQLGNIYYVNWYSGSTD